MHLSSVPASASFLSRLAASVALLALLAACGYKGPLYMPPPAPPDQSLTAPPTDSPPGPAAPRQSGADQASPR